MKMGHKTEEESPEIIKEKEIIEKVKLLHEEFNKNKRNSNVKTDKRIVKRRKLEIYNHQSKPTDKTIKMSDFPNITNENCSNGKPKENTSISSDFSSITNENCSNVTLKENISKSSDFSNITDKNCSNVTINLPIMTKNDHNLSDLSTIATENCSKVTDKNQIMTNRIYESSDLSNIATENHSNVSSKIKSIEDKIVKMDQKLVNYNRGNKPKLITFNVNKLRSQKTPAKSSLKCQNNVNSNKRQKSTDKVDNSRINIHKNDGISTLKSATLSPDRAKKVISSPVGHRWRHKSSPILNKNRISSDGKDRNMKVKSNEKVKRVLTKKVSPKLGQKQAKLTGYFGERGSRLELFDNLSLPDEGNVRQIFDS